jgi:hypothetical protein
LHAGLNAPRTEAAGADGFDVDVYGSIRRVVHTQVQYIGELAALAAWYAHVRARLAVGHPERMALYGRAQAVVRVNLRERIEQLEAFAARMPRSADLLSRRAPGDPRIGQQRAFHEQWPQLRRHLEQEHGTEPPAALLEAVGRAAERETAYTRIVAGLAEPVKAAGRSWLRGIRERVAAPRLLAAIPALPSRG